MERDGNRSIIYFILGIIIFILMRENILLILLSSLLIFIHIYGLSRYDRNTNHYHYILFLILGISLAMFKFEQLDSSKYSDREIIIDAKVISQVKEDTYILKSKNIFLDSKRYRLNRKIMLKLEEGEELDLGARILFSSKVYPPKVNGNPKLYNHKNRLLSQDLYLSTSIKSRDIIKYSDHPIDRKYSCKSKFNSFVRGTFSSYLAEKDANFISGVILGDYSRMDQTELNKFRDTGLAHILAVSGLHIAIISSFILQILAFLTIDKKLSMLLTLIIIWIYAYLINFPVSILRSNIVISIVYLSRILDEPNDPINSLVIAIFLLLIKNPFYLLNISFQLSFLASFSIILLSPRIRGIFSEEESKLADAISVILAIQIALFPIQTYYFNNLVVVNFISNIILIPIFSLSLILSFLILGFQLSLSFLNQLLGPLLNFFLSIQNFLLEIIKNLTFLNIRLSSPDLINIVGYYILVFIIFNLSNFTRLSKSLKKFLAYNFLIYFIFISLELLLTDQIYIDIIDVGQGDSILLQYDGGNILIDTGGEVFGDFSIGENISLPYLVKHNIFKIKALVITHFHDDHCKAAPLLLDELDVENTFISYNTSKNPVYKSIEKKSKNLKILREGDIINLGNNKKLRVLSPSKEFKEGLYSENDMSLTLLLEAYGKKILFTGDIEDKVEKYLIEEQAKYIRNIDLLKVAHHGSRTSSREDFVSLTNPEGAIFTVGKNNSFGHPHDEVLARYKSQGSKIYRMDESGRIRIRMDKNSIEVEEFLKNSLGILWIGKIYLSYIYAYILVYMDLNYRLRKENTIELYRF